jgi:hypothetical protein
MRLSTIFLSSSEAQDGSYAMLRPLSTVLSSFVVINALWRGDLVQRRDDDRNVVCKSRFLKLGGAVTSSRRPCVRRWGFLFLVPLGPHAYSYSSVRSVSFRNRFLYLTPAIATKIPSAYSFGCSSSLCIHKLVRYFPLYSNSSKIIGTVREPLDRLDPLRRHFDLWEIVLYIMALAFSFEGASIDALERDCLQLMINRFEQCLFFRTLGILTFT